MRTRFDKELMSLHEELILMSALCEEAISGATDALFCPSKHKERIIEKVNQLECQINEKEAFIEKLCEKLILHEQPVASDLRMITVAQRLIVDMERIGDQAQDIAEISAYCAEDISLDALPIKDMANHAKFMLTSSIDSFIHSNLNLAMQVIESDDKMDKLFDETKEVLVEQIKHGENELCSLDLLMIAKYLERIGDHSENIAQQAVFSITGERLS